MGRIHHHRHEGRLPADEPKIRPDGHLHQRSGEPGPAGDPHWTSHLQELPPQQGWKVLHDEEIGHPHLRLRFTSWITQDCQKRLHEINLMEFVPLLENKHSGMEKKKKIWGWKKKKKKKKK